LSQCRRRHTCSRVRHQSHVLIILARTSRTSLSNSRKAHPQLGQNASAPPGKPAARRNYIAPGPACASKESTINSPRASHL
jgi:hypothetical protein